MHVIFADSNTGESTPALLSPGYVIENQPPLSILQAVKDKCVCYCSHTVFLRVLFAPSGLQHYSYKSLTCGSFVFFLSQTELVVWLKINRGSGLDGDLCGRRHRGRNGQRWLMKGSSPSLITGGDANTGGRETCRNVAAVFGSTLWLLAGCLMTVMLRPLKQGRFNLKISLCLSWWQKYCIYCHAFTNQSTLYIVLFPWFFCSCGLRQFLIISVVCSFTAAQQSRSFTTDELHIFTFCEIHPNYILNSWLFLSE